MGNVKLVDGRIEVEWGDGGNLALPESLSDEFLRAVFQAEPGDEAHIACIHANINTYERERFAVACALSDEFSPQYAQAALTWADVGADGDWQNIPLKIVWSDAIKTSLIDTLFVTAEGVWFVATSSGKLFTDGEFAALYDNDIRTHLKRYVVAVQNTLTRVIEIMDSPLVDRRVTIARDGNVVTETRRGPMTVPVKNWRYASNETFLSED